ncbi:ArnT family glycosyltransferase [Kitasatospora azatica]|uniref:ArnT family glycosyltransferase n=1 Tax=Kitasatospora azatica TaxID=58347 RepID=UPI00068E6723|nr:phospholipid carrier-dependent glycosyltransferase [Kitasatospora azatica]
MATVIEETFVSDQHQPLVEEAAFDPGGRPARLARRLGARPDLLIVTVLVAVVVAVQALNIGNFPTVSDDEGTYLAQAWAIQHGHGLAHYSYWYDHPPLGWVQIAALSWIPALLWHGALVVMNARVIMLPVSAAGAALTYLVARRIELPRWAAALATVVFGLSPLSVTMQREIYLDNFAVVWMLAAFACALSPRRHLWHQIAAGLFAAVSVLSKETMVIVAPALLMAVWRGTDRATRKFAVVGFLTAFSMIGVQYLLYAVLKGELLPGPGHNSLIGALQYQLGRGGSGNILRSGSVSNLTLHWWLVRDPILIFAGLAASALALAVRRLREIGVAAVLLVVVAMRPNGYLPAMYVIQVLPFFALAIAGIADFGVRTLLRLPIGRLARFGASPRDLVAVLAIALLGLVAPHWESGDETADTALSNSNYVAAAQWLDSNIPDPAHRRIVVDDAMWLDAVQDGFQPGLGAIWFYKVDLDPAVTRTLPNGWRDLDYVVLTSVIRQDPNGLPTVRAAIAHSTTVATFGTGDQQITIQRVDHDGSGQ